VQVLDVLCFSDVPEERYLADFSPKRLTLWTSRWPVDLDFLLIIRLSLVSLFLSLLIKKQLDLVFKTSHSYFSSGASCQLWEMHGVSSSSE